MEHQPDANLEPDVFLWLVLIGALVHLVAVLWLCKGCWGSLRLALTRPVETPKGTRAEAGKRWVHGEYQVNLRYRPSSSREIPGSRTLASLIKRG